MIRSDRSIFKFPKLLLSVLVVSMVWSFSAFAQEAPLPPAADSSRVQDRVEERLKERSPQSKTEIKRDDNAVFVDVPEGANEIETSFSEIRIVGADHYFSNELAPLVDPYEGKKITLDRIWLIANEITKKYRQDGFFLARAFVPQQEIDEGGVVEIHVLQGFIEGIKFGTEKKPPQSLYRDITKFSPVRISDLENLLLRLNDLPGYNVTGVLEASKKTNGAAILNILPVDDVDEKLFVEVNNHGSRFIGPFQVLANYQDSFFDFQETSITFSNSLWFDKLSYIGVQHTVPVSEKIEVDAGFSYVDSEPGYTLERLELESNSFEVNVGGYYHHIRKRAENLSFGAHFHALNSSSNVLGVPLVRDDLRWLELEANYDFADKYLGYNFLNAKLAKGLDFMDSSDFGDANISRRQAEDDFTKLELSYARQQVVNQDWIAIYQLEGQLASGPLFSSQEFGYGGQKLGRAFDASEIVGDHGLASGIEFRYSGLELRNKFDLTPYLFYDIGVVWNDDTDQEFRESAASAGFGLRFSHETGAHGNFGIAWPLTRDVETPIFGQDQDNPRILLQISKSF
tara:strand:- start:614 stop:2323 length:1710 start_codon:yes stop_codon:yes gene_type:complete